MATSNLGNAVKPVATKKVPGGLISAYTAQLTARMGTSVLIDVTAPLPENYQLQLSTNFDNPFNSPLSNLLDGKAAQAAQTAESATTAATGFTSRTKWLSSAVWQGGNLFKLVVPFVIVAQDNAATDVVRIMRNLLKLVAPSEENGVLKAPGPNLKTAYSEGNDATGELITIRLGDFFEMTPCVIEDVNCDFDTQMDNNSKCPISVTITVSITSYWVTTRQDLDKYFKRVLPGE